MIGHIAVAAVLAVALAPATALACDEAAHVQARHAGPSAGSAPLVIGDSTLILSAPLLGRMGIEADAHGCRQFEAGVTLAARRRRLPDAVGLALGANGPVSRTQIAAARRVLGPRRFLLLVTPRNLAGTAGVMRAAAAAHPDRVAVLDWARFSRGRPWFAGDGVHVDATGARYYADFLRAGLAPFLATPRAERRLNLPGQVAAPGVRDCGTGRVRGRVARVVITRGPHGFGCAAARRLVAGPRLAPPPRWRYFDWRRVGRGPWTDVLARRDGSRVVAAVERPLRMAWCPGSPSSPCR